VVATGDGHRVLADAPPPGATAAATSGSDSAATPATPPGVNANHLPDARLQVRLTSIKAVKIIAQHLTRAVVNTLH